jgi:hypothetical protein
MPNFCPNCGAELKYKEAEICPSCGVRIREPPAPAKEKNLYPAAVIGLIIIVGVMSIILAFQLSSSCMPGASLAHPARFANPGFETGNLNGWTTGSTTGIRGDMSHSGTYSCHLDMSGTPATDFVSQSVDLTRAASVTFWGIGESNTWAFSIYVDGTLVQTSNAVSNSWTRYTVPVSGYTGIHTVSIKWNGGPGVYGADIDDFSIEYL